VCCCVGSDVDSAFDRNTFIGEKMKAVDIILIIAVLIVVAGAAALAFRIRRKGSCHGDCEGCGMCSAPDAKVRKNKRR